MKTTNENLTTKPPTFGNVLLCDVLSMLAKKDLQIKLFIGHRDCLNGYGWHVRYYVQVFKTIEYCPKCREKENTNHSDTAHPYNNHSHRSELQCIYDKEFMNEQDLCNGLLNTV